MYMSVHACMCVRAEEDALHILQFSLILQDKKN